MSFYVYRCYSADGRLLYVGQTQDLMQRLAQHQERAFWSADVSKVTAKIYRTREIARTFEQRAIREERPRFNLQGRWGARAKWERSDYSDYLTVLLDGDAVYRTYRRRQIESLFGAYRFRFGEQHPRHNEVTTNLNKAIAEHEAQLAESQRRNDERRRESDAREAADEAAHLAACCACRFGIIVDPEMIQESGNGRAVANGLISA